ncbi:MAG: DUF4193 family protein [Mycobacteriales bacterium]
MAQHDEDETTVESSLEELLQKKAAERPVDDEEEDVLELDQGREEQPLDNLVVKALPQQANEFTCRSCFLVKHQSQLANAKRMICRDCA